MNYKNFKAESEAHKQLLVENSKRELGKLSDSLMAEIAKKMCEAPPHLLDAVTEQGKRDYEARMRARMDDLNVRNNVAIAEWCDARRPKTIAMVFKNGKWVVEVMEHFKGLRDSEVPAGVRAAVKYCRAHGGRLRSGMVYRGIVVHEASTANAVCLRLAGFRPLLSTRFNHWVWDEPRGYR